MDLSLYVLYIILLDKRILARIGINCIFVHVILIQNIANASQWAYRTSKRDSIGVSPYSLTYKKDVVLPMEVVVPSLRESRQNGINPQEYSKAMKMELEAFDGKILQALDHIMI